MSVRQKFEAGGMFPNFVWPSVSGASVTPGAGVDWLALVIYRGAHCPLCTTYLHELSRIQPKFEKAQIRLWALSADPLDRAAEQVRNEGWQAPVLAELQEDQMRALGLYISAPGSPQETDRNFAEPATFVINPKSRVQMLNLSNAPFARPDPEKLLAGIRFVMESDYPIRGTAE